MEAIDTNNSRMRMAGGVTGLLVLLLALSFLGSEPVLRLLHLPQVNAGLILISRLLVWLCTALLWVYARRLERQSLLLYKETVYPFFTFLLSVVVLLLIILVGSVVIGIVLKLAKLNQVSDRMQQLVAIFRQQPWLLVFTSLTAGITEELMFRGYLQTRLEKLFGNSTAAVIISSLLFGLIHFRYGTVANVVIPFFIGLVFALYYRRYRSLTVLMVCHFVWDLVVLLLMINMRHS